MVSASPRSTASRCGRTCGLRWGKAMPTDGRGCVVVLRLHIFVCGRGRHGSGHGSERGSTGDRAFQEVATAASFLLFAFFRRLVSSEGCLALLIVSPPPCVQADVLAAGLLTVMEGSGCVKQVAGRPCRACRQSGHGSDGRCQTWEGDRSVPGRVRREPRDAHENVFPAIILLLRYLALNPSESNIDSSHVFPRTIWEVGLWQTEATHTDVPLCGTFRAGDWHCQV